jgi:hypothetical protein
MNEAFKHKDKFYEINVGEETLSCELHPNTLDVTWRHNYRYADEGEIANVLARWAVEGV